ncbi:HORMA domain-containing protein 2 [Terrapene carolina triunguis]|uniref:HORMA domain-containing protein 2 n=1 Tax=Terrapene triunguis TaxID=2587831 RepID=UPI0011568FAE|nr:HORMA domain-containing protein 2 [Terrapene carolina triunguis]
MAKVHHADVVWLGSLVLEENGSKRHLNYNFHETLRVTELYQFKFKYTKDGPQMDIVSFAKGVSSEEIKKGSILLIRKLYLLMQNLGPLPNDITLTMKLFYYNDVTPDDYQPPGFKEDSSPDNLLFDGDPVNLKVGSISTGFHILKVRVTTESKRMRTLGSSLIQENGPTEISHQGLDCDEEESSKKELMGVKGTDRVPCTKASQQTYSLDLAFSQEEEMKPRKKRKVSEPVQLLPAGRN